MGDQFWDIAGELMSEDDRLVEGTIMGQPCLRLDGEFVAMPEHRSTRMVVKLDASRVEALIESGIAESFSPAGKIFREWAAIAEPHHWEKLLREAVAKAAAAS